MEITHPYLRMAAGLLLAAGLVSACSGGSSGAAATPTDPGPTDPGPTEPMEPTVTRTPEGCTDASPTCTVASRAANGVVTTTVTTNMMDMTAMTNTRTVTVSGSTRTITVTSTAEGHDNRVTRVEMLTCTGGANCVRTSRATTTYPAAGSTGSPVTTTIMYSYSSSRGGRIETTEKSGGTLVQTFNQYEGGDLVSTRFTHTGGLIVTVTPTDAAGMRVETTYATAADAMAGENPVSVRTGTRAANADFGFMPESMVTRTDVVSSPVESGGRTLVETEYRETIPAAGDEATPPVVRSRTYITGMDASGREIQRRTYLVDANNDEGNVVRTVATEHPGADDAAPVTRVTTTEYMDDGSTVTGTTVVTTDADGEATAEVRNAGGDLITTTVTSSDGNTVATLYGPGRAATDPDEGTTVTVITRAGGITVTETSTGDGDSRVVSLAVTRDEAGAETRRVTLSADALTRTTAATEYMAGGGSMVTTVTETRANTDADTEYMTTGTVVVTNDDMGREVLRVTRDAEGMETDRRVTVWGDGQSRTETRTFSGGEGDMLMDVGIREWDEDGEIADDIVIHPGVQDHAMVSDAQYDAIQAGLAPRSNSRTLMGQAILHLDYDDDDAFASFSSVISGVDTDLELEVVTRSPACAAAGCTYSRLRGGNALAPAWTELRLRRSSDNAVIINTDPNYRHPADHPVTSLQSDGGIESVINPFWTSIAANNAPDAVFPATYDHDGNPSTPAVAHPLAGQDSHGWLDGQGRRAAQGILLELLSDLLGIGGAGLSTEFTGDGANHRGAMATTDLPSYGFVAAPTSTAGDRDRNTYTHLKTTELPRGGMPASRSQRHYRCD